MNDYQESFGPTMGIGIAIFFVLLLIPFCFFLNEQSKALRAVQQVNRAMEPSGVWWQLIPLFGLYWQFIVVKNLADSLRNEFESRNNESQIGIWEEGITDEVNIHPTYTTGRWYCITVALSFIPFIGFLTGLFALVLWITYWGQVVKYRKLLEA
jgi:hypothetical protein